MRLSWKRLLWELQIKTNKNYKFVSKDNNPTIAIRRVGSKAGYIYYSNIENRNINTHYFVKILKKHTRLLKLNLNKEKQSTLGAYSISKMDIIKKLNLLL